MSDDIVREFLVESGENLDLLDRELVQLEKDPANRGTLASVFRTIHTIKGTCGFLGFTKLESVANVGENLLSKLRDGELGVHPEITTALLRMVDAIRQMLESIEANGNEGARKDEDLIKTLTRLSQAPTAKETTAKETIAAPVAAASPPATSERGTVPAAVSAPPQGVPAESKREAAAESGGEHGETSSQATSESAQ